MVQQLKALLDHLKTSAYPRLLAVAHMLTKWNEQRIDTNSDGLYKGAAATIQWSPLGAGTVPAPPS